MQLSGKDLWVNDIQIIGTYREWRSLIVNNRESFKWSDCWESSRQDFSSDLPSFLRCTFTNTYKKQKPTQTHPTHTSALVARQVWLCCQEKGGVTLSAMKGSRYLVISYLRAPRLPLRSRATGDSETETPKYTERERGPRPITGPVRVTADRGRRALRVRRKWHDSTPSITCL